MTGTTGMGEGEDDWNSKEQRRLKWQRVRKNNIVRIESFRFNLIVSLKYENKVMNFFFF